MAHTSDGDASQPPGLPAENTRQTAATEPGLSGPASLLPSSQRPARKALLLFSGPIARRDGVAAFLSQMDYASDSVDNNPLHGGGARHNLLNHAIYERLLQRCAGGHYSV
eukprot:5781500-Pleurochrysis_carterae.AAC.1